jgi:hypothetical protein
MPWLAGGLLASAGLGAVGSFLSNKPKTTKTTQESSGTSSSSGAGSSVRTLPGELKPLQGGLIDQLMASLQDPSAGTSGIRLAGRNAINQSYAGADQALRDKFLSSNGTSGKYGTAQRKLEGSRAGSLGGFEGDMASLVLGQRNNNMSLIERLLQQSGGVDTTNSSDSSQSSKGSGTNTSPDNSMGAMLGSAGNSLSSLTTLMTLNKLLSGA